MSSQIHEDPRYRDEMPTASERSFGILFAIVFLVISLWPLINHGNPHWWALVIAAIFAIVAFVRAEILKPLNRAWLALGNALHIIVSPLILGMIYVIAVMPTGLFLRLTGRDPLRLKFDKDAKSYWQQRHPPGPPTNSFKNQF